MKSQDLLNANSAPVPNGIRDQILSAIWLGLLFATVFILYYEWRKNIQWESFMRRANCFEIERKMIKFPNWDGVPEMIDEQRFLCDDGFVYVR